MTTAAACDYEDRATGTRYRGGRLLDEFEYCGFTVQRREAEVIGQSRFLVCLKKLSGRWRCLRSLYVMYADDMPFGRCSVSGATPDECLDGMRRAVRMAIEYCGRRIVDLNGRMRDIDAFMAERGAKEEEDD